ncbi:hypothetical protein AACH06_20985 [Ideonella sp. DXS29W]|uniref:HAF repeat-containing protein n=1 Tax=Ideonella lacteola TaxID=2984193 RepID=A0ABU9BV13_9BURK
MNISVPVFARLALVAGTLAGLSQASQALPTYAVRVVTDEGGVQSSTALNTRGTVAINTGSDGGSYSCSKTACTPIPSLPNDLQLPFAYPRDIDDRGYVVGVSYTGSTSHAMLWDGQTVRDLGTFGEDDCGGCKSHSEASAINGNGVVVGYSDTANIDFQAFMWCDGTMTKLPTLGGTRSGANGVNDAGDVVGFASLATGMNHAFLYRDGQMRDLGVLRSGKFSTAFAVNNLGQVVGSSDTGQNKPSTVAFIYDQQGGMRELPLLKGWRQMSASAINDAGWVVGTAVSSSGNLGFVFDGHGSFDLNLAMSEKDRKHWRIYHANDINSKGQILVEAQDKKKGDYRVLVLTPQ